MDTRDTIPTNERCLKCGQPKKDGMCTFCPPAETTQEIIETKEIKDINIGYIFIPTEVIINKDGSIKFTEDLYRDDLPSMMSDHDVEILIKAGILDRQNPDEFIPFDKTKSCYQLATNDFSDWISLKADDLNRALSEGRLKVTIDEKGEIQLTN